MGRTWQRTFEVSAPVERVWEVLTDPEVQLRMQPRRVENQSPETGDKRPAATAGIRILEAAAMERLRWAAEREDLPERAEFTVTFESTETGCRVTLTRAGFGDGEDADIFSEASWLGSELGFVDLLLYAQTGVMVWRHNTPPQSFTGATYRDTAVGVEVVRVTPRSFASDAGLQRGDILIRIGAAPIFARADVWLLTYEHPAGTSLDIEFVRGRELMKTNACLSDASAHALGEHN